MPGPDSVTTLTLLYSPSAHLPPAAAAAAANSIQLCMTLAIPWTIACQAPLSLGFSRQEYWRGLLFPMGEIIV